MISQIVDSIVCGGNGPSLIINGVKRGMPLIRTLEVSLCPMLLSEARNFGLSNDWIQVCVLPGYFYFSYLCLCAVFAYCSLGLGSM
jgi:hypothetical protein